MKRSSLPDGECGLKFFIGFFAILSFGVAPRWGVWIEIYKEVESWLVDVGRSPMGSVD